MALVNIPSVEDMVKKFPELKLSDLEILKDWLKKQPHLPQMSDSELALFLHARDYRIETAKKTIDAFFTTKTNIPEYLSDRDPLGNKGIREIMDVLCCIQMPSTTPEGYRAVYGKLIDFGPSNFSLNNAMKIFSMSAELWLYNAGACDGHILVLNLDGIGLGHVPHMNPMMIKKALYYLQEGLPVRLESIHVINLPPFMDLLFNIFKPFIKKKLFDKISFHSSVQSLEKKVPINILPNEIGGKAGPLKKLWANHVKELEEHRAWFLEQETRKANESARPGKAKSPTDLFSVEGSFRKLGID